MAEIKRDESGRIIIAENVPFILSGTVETCGQSIGNEEDPSSIDNEEDE